MDVDGVISLFGFTPGEGQLPGPLHWIDGVAHCIPEDVGARLLTQVRNPAEAVTMGEPMVVQGV